MRFLLLLLFVSSVLTDEKIAKSADKNVEAKKELTKSLEETKSKTGKRDSSDQTGSFGINTNDEPFKPMLNSPAPFVAAASDTQQVYYDKNQVTVGDGAGKAKSVTNPQNTNAYRAQYSQVAHPQQQQQQQQQQLNKNHLRVGGKNPGIQSQQHNQPSILYAVPQNPAYHYERIPQQQQQIHLQAPPPPPPLPAAQHGQQKQIQYVIAIPMSYLRQLQQQLMHQQQQEQPTHLQVYKGQQQPQYQQQQLQAVPVYSIAGPLARDHHGAYRPFHRFALTAVNDVSTDAQHQAGSSSSLPQPLLPASTAPPGYVTQYMQIPASVLLAAMQSTQVQQQQQRPVQLPQNLYHQQQQQPQILQLQQPIHQQHIQTQSPQLYFYQPQQQQQQQQQVQVQLKQSQPLHTLTSPPVYAYHVNPLQQQQQQPSQQHQTFQQLTETQQQQQQQNVGKQPHRVRGVRPTANFATSAEAYETEEKAQLVALQAPAHTNLNAHTHTNAHSQQFIAPAPVTQQQSAPAHQVVQAQAPKAYEHLVHFNPQYVQHYQEKQHQPVQHRQPHRLQIQPHHHTPLAEHLNNLPFSQGIHGPTPLPFLRIHPAAAEVSPLYNMVSPSAIPQPFISGPFQPPFTPLGTPSKVTSFTNVLLQPFVGHPSSFAAPEIGTVLAGSADSTTFTHPAGGIHYGAHLYHPPTSATTVLAGNKQHNTAAAADPRVLNTTGNKISASSAKAVAGSPTIVKYP